MSGDGDLKLTEKIEKASVVLVDIAGTSSSICFVKDTLFPFVIKEAESYLADKWDTPELQEIVKSLKELDSEILKEGEKDEIIKSLVVSIKSLTEKNSDNEHFKKLQGLVYQAGYESGNLKGHVYPDVATQLPLWANGKRVCVYSTGSEQSQKLLFTHSTEGDLSKHITEYFDQSIGKKTEAVSYKKIAEKLECKPEEILFLSDLVEETKAAVEAGLISILVAREGNADISETDKKAYSVIKSFTELSCETSGKRKNTEETEKEAPPAKVAKTEPEKVAEKETEEEVATTNKAAEEEEKMEVDATEVAESKDMETKANDTETVTSTSETSQETLDKPAATTTEISTCANEAETKEANEKDHTITTTTKDKILPSETETSTTSTTTTPTTTSDTPKTTETSSEVTEKPTEVTEKPSEITTEKKVTEEKPAEDKKTEEKKEAPKAIEATTKETEKQTENETNKVAEPKETEKPDTNVAKVDEAKIEENGKENEKKEKVTDKVDSTIAEEKAESKTEVEAKKDETTSKTETATKKEETLENKGEKETEAKTDEVVKTEEKTPVEDKKEENTVEKKPEVDEKVSETKEEKLSEKKVEEKEAENKEVDTGDSENNKNGDLVENGANSEDKEKKTIEEKENNKDLANGASHVENGDADESNKKLDESESEIKVKKIESAAAESTESVDVKA